VERTADTLVGRVLDGRYRVGPRIARGGMATVYEATDLRLDRPVAVKVMHEGLAEDPEFVRRFESEARSAARLAHQNVVAVFDTGDDHGTLFLVMEYVPGLTMRDLIRAEAPMSPARALSVVEPVLHALAAAHDAGILHRDVKPENVLMADDGRVKVADFGLARAINSETQHTATGGVLIGSVSYLSPELVVNGHADARADVYAVGVLIFELLTGHKPHQAASPIQVAYKHVHEDVPAPSASTPGIPPYVDALVARATARDTALRPADARVLLHQVRRVRNALDHGVVTDPDLIADLTPTTPVGGSRTPTGEIPAQIIEPHDLAYLAEDNPDDGFYDQERERRIVPAPSSRAPTTSGRGAVRAQPPRRPRRGWVLLTVVLLLALVAGAGGWYLGIARYTVTPGVLNLSEAAARA
jgi:serine/threonine protein kinase